MAIEFGLLALLAAFLHAAWNALVKSSSDRLLTLSAVSLMQSTTGALLFLFVPIPEPSSWLFIGLSTILHYFYFIFLYHAYRFGDLSQIYPLARGLAPVLVAIGAAIFANERLSFLSLLGVIIASLGIASIGFLHESSLRKNPSALFFAAGTGIIIAGYTVADGIGVRSSGSPFGYIAWLFFLEFPIVIFVLYRRWGFLIISWRLEWKHFIGTGLSSVLAYGIVIFAVAFAPMAAVSALRETSVIMAALIGTFVLGERPWEQRVTASVLVAGGVALITGFS